MNFANGSPNSNNNNSNEKLVSTRIKTFYGETAMMQILYVNERISLRISPCIGANTDGTRQYDYTAKAYTAIPFEKCIALAKVIEDKILPVIENVRTGGSLDENIRIGFTLGEKNNMLFIEYKNDDGVANLYLKFYTMFSENGAPLEEGSFTYKFNKISVITKCTENGVEETTSVESEFLFLYEKLKNVYSLMGDASHSSNLTPAYVKQPQPQTNNGYTQNYNQTANNNGSTQNYSAPVGTFDTSAFPFS